MKPHRLISYGLMAAGAVASLKAVFNRWQWEESNVHAAIMLDWDDVQAVATRALDIATVNGQTRGTVADLLRQFKEAGATHLSIPELTINRLLQRGELSLTQGSSAERVYLRAQRPEIAELVTVELQARLPHIQARASQARQPLISFQGDLPTVAGVGLGFNPAQAELAQRVELSPVARPIGYDWVQPAMIDRTLDQAAALGCKLVAFQGNLIPGHEFKIQTTVEAMRRHGLTYAYFRERRHQKGDWFLAKALANDGLTVLAHEFEPLELLDEDWFTVSYRWANLAVEAGVRLCSVRFFRILHAADPLESLAYVEELARALTEAGFLLGYVGEVDLTAFQAERDTTALTAAGLSTAGAVGLAADLLPIPDRARMVGLGAVTAALAGLPFLEKAAADRTAGHHDHHHHEHDHDHNHTHHHAHDHHHHDHDHDHSHDHGPALATAYAPKGLALASAIAYPAAAVAFDGAEPIKALVHNFAVTTAGATSLTATAAETDYLLGIEEYRGYHLDWLIPLGLAAYTSLRGEEQPKPPWRWLPLAGLALAALKSLSGGPAHDLPASYDREHRHAHTHHLSAFQRILGDTKMAVSPKPLRKWSLLGPLGAVATILLRRKGQEELADIALTTATVGQVAALTGFRNGQRPLANTLEGRAKSWGIGALLAGLTWLIVWLWSRKS